jgi:hypothetical protein
MGLMLWYVYVYILFSLVIIRPGADGVPYLYLQRPCQSCKNLQRGPIELFKGSLKRIVVRYRTTPLVYCPLIAQLAGVTWKDKIGITWEIKSHQRQWR